MTTDWWQRGVIYQIYVRSFADGDGDGIGDLQGIVARLDHLNNGTPSSLGVDAILLSPIYPSPGFDAGYDVSDHAAVDPSYGAIQDFDQLVDEAHRRGMAVILDLVMNHTSHLHRWFESSRASRPGPHTDWYIWRDARRRMPGARPRPPNNWASFFGGSAWTWEPARGQFYLHTFLPQQPDLNWQNPNVRSAMLEVVRFWLAHGVDGFRLDVFNAFFKHPELPSNPRRFPGGLRRWERQWHIYDKDQQPMNGLLAEFRAILDAVPGRMSVGELFGGGPAQAAGYAAPRHLIFDFRLLEQPWRADALAAAIDEREAAFGANGWPTVVLSNHDRPRHATRFARGANRDAVAKSAATLLLTLRGTPFLYYGEEIALGDVKVPRQEIHDPPARYYWPFPIWWNRDASRAPLPWSAGLVGRASPARSWVRSTPDAQTRNVVAQAADPDSVLAYYRRLIWLRRSSPALQVGDFSWIARGRSGLLAYLRSVADERMLVVINTLSRTADLALPTANRWETALSTIAAKGASAGGSASLRLAPHEAVILRAAHPE